MSMKISILGTRGEIPVSVPYHSKHSGILVDDELLIDLGEKSFLSKHLKWILITHFHPDHAYFVHRQREETLSLSIPIYAPESHRLLPEGIVLEEEVTLGPYTIIPIPTHHSKNVKSQGYVVRRDNYAFLYTGDLVWIDKKYHERIGMVDLIITEASFIRKGGMVRKDQDSGAIYGHNGISNLISLLKPFAKNFLFLHFGSWFYDDMKKSRQQLLALGKENEINVIVGYDGMVIHQNEVE